jgi:hypothetical protein
MDVGALSICPRLQSGGAGRVVVDPHIIHGHAGEGFNIGLQGVRQPSVIFFFLGRPRSSSRRLSLRTGIIGSSGEDGDVSEGMSDANRPSRLGLRDRRGWLRSRSRGGCQRPGGLVRRHSLEGGTCGYGGGWRGYAVRSALGRGAAEGASRAGLSNA